MYKDMKTKPFISTYKNTNCLEINILERDLDGEDVRRDGQTTFLNSAEWLYF